MDNFSFYAPTWFEFGRDAESRCGQLVKKFGGTRVLVHFGGGSAVKSGLLARVEKSLAAAGIEYTELGGVKPNPVDSMVYRGIDICREKDIDFILAVGGGSTIDSSKAVAAGAVYDGDFWDYYQGKPVEKALPVGTVLTISAAGSEGSADSVITKENGMLKRAATGDALRPVFSVLNPALTETLPAYQTACGTTDIIAHLYERYLTNTKNVETTDRMIEGLMLAIIDAGRKCIDNPHDYEARANFMWAGMMAHNNSCGAGRSQDWTSHMVEHEISSVSDCAHGAGLAVCMPAVFKYTMNHDVMRFAKIAVRVWGCQMDFDNPERTAACGIERLRQYLVSIGMPEKLSELGAGEEDIEKMAHMLCYGERDGVLSGFTDITEKDAVAIYRMML